MEKAEAQKLLKLLRTEQAGRDDWNKWRGVQENEQSLNRAILRGVDLGRKELDGFDLHGLDLTKTNFANAKLNGANLSRATLTNAQLNGAQLRKANLEQATITAANLYWTDFSNANLRDANLENSAFTDETFVQGKGVPLAHDLDPIISDPNSLDVTSFNGADLRGTTGLVLDGQDIRNARFSPGASDAWSIVRRNYTGALLFFNLLFLLGFLAPYAARAAKWSAVAAAQAALAGVDWVPPPDVAIQTEPWSLWQLMLGWDKGWAYAVTAAILVVYNVFRALLTRQLAQVREAEERSGYAPAWKSYNRWSWVHQYFMRYVQFFAMGSFLWHAIPWLFVTVDLPS